MSTKFVFLTGGVISSLGKGITAASLGALFTARRLRTTIVKIDGYLNVDAGLMSPYEHGEVFVTADGGETDLDIGHYERFLGAHLSKGNNITSGKVYMSVIQKERRGEYLGKTVQVIPHITGEIREWLLAAAAGFDVCIVEIGGVVGDIESMSFLEAARQLKLKMPADCTFVHLALLPYIDYINENKTKPVQNSVRELLSKGIQPDIVICRTKRGVSDAERAKIAMFSNVADDCVFSSADAASKYVVPQMLAEERVDERVLQRLGLAHHPLLDFDKWERFAESVRAQSEYPVVRVAFVRKYVVNADNYVSLIEALTHSSIALRVRVELVYIDSEAESMHAELESCDCVLVPGGWGSRGIEGKVSAVAWAREADVPFLGICYGYQLAAVEFGRSTLGLTDCHSVEVKPECAHPVIAEINTVLGGTSDDTGFCFPRKIRVGARRVFVREGTLLSRIYGGATEVTERYRHRYCFNSAYKQRFEDAGMRFSSHNSDDGQETQETIELPDRRFFLGVQFHPELLSGPFAPHPIITEFLRAGAHKHAHVHK